MAWSRCWKIRDLFRGNTFLSYRDFCSHFALKTNLLTYYGLCPATPPNWIKILKGKLQPPANKSTGSDRISLLTSSLVNLLLFMFCWREMRPCHHQKKDWEKPIEMSSKLIKLTRCLSGLLKAQLSMFQFKILHHILPTNATLHRFGIKEHDHCHLCAEKQTITRLFATCLMLIYFGHVLVTVGTEKTTLQSHFLKNKYFMVLHTPCLGVSV